MLGIEPGSCESRHKHSTSGVLSLGNWEGTLPGFMGKSRKQCKRLKEQSLDLKVPRKQLTQEADNVL